MNLILNMTNPIYTRFRILLLSANIAIKCRPNSLAKPALLVHWELTIMLFGIIFNSYYYFYLYLVRIPCNVMHGVCHLSLQWRICAMHCGYYFSSHSKSGVQCLAGRAKHILLTKRIRRSSGYGALQHTLLYTPTVYDRNTGCVRFVVCAPLLHKLYS